MLDRGKVPRHLITLENLLSIVCQTYYHHDMFFSPSRDQKSGEKKAETLSALVAIQKSASPIGKKRGRPSLKRTSKKSKRPEPIEARKDEKNSGVHLADSKKNSKSKGEEAPYSAREMLDFLVSPLKNDQELGTLTRKLDCKRNRHFRDRPLPFRQAV